MQANEIVNVKDILANAIYCDQNGRIFEAESHYHEAIDILMNLSQDETDPTRKRVYHDRIEEYISRAEQIKEKIRQHRSRGELVENIAIDDNAMNRSYNTLFGKYLDGSVREVLIEEPYLIDRYHFRNLLAFFEVLMKQCMNLKYIRLITKVDPKDSESQLTTLENIKGDLKRVGIVLCVILEKTLHDRKIILSNGYIIKIGRGLHYFKPLYSTLCLGAIDYDFRKCFQTEIDIWSTGEFS